MRTRTQLGALGQRRLGEMADWHGLVRPEWLEYLPPEPERWECDHEKGIIYHGRKASDSDGSETQ